MYCSPCIAPGFCIGPMDLDKLEIAIHNSDVKKGLAYLDILIGYKESI